MIEKRWLTVSQAAEILQIHRKTAYSWAARGILPMVRISGVLRVDRTRLEADLERQIKEKFK